MSFRRFTSSTMSFLIALTESLASYSSIYFWCYLISCFYSQLAVLIYTQLPYLPGSISLSTIHSGAGILHKPKFANPGEGKGETWPKMPTKAVSFSMWHLSLLHAWNVLNCTSDLFNNSSKCQEEMLLSSLYPDALADAIFHGPQLEFMIRPSRCLKPAIEMWTVFHQGEREAHVRHRVGERACLPLLLFRNGAAWNRTTWSVIKRKSALNMLLRSISQANPSMAILRTELFYAIRWLKRACVSLSSMTLRDWKLERKK